MPCNPLTESQFSPPPPPAGSGGMAPQLPSLNIPFSPISAPDLTDLYNLIEFLIPPGALKVNFQPDFLNDIYGAVNDLLTKFYPFLMMYTFFLPILKLILCIIEVLCALLNPFKLPGAISTLFRVCIPEFLNLFPFFAVPIMIISLLLLILTIVEYLITRLLTIIEILIANITALGRAASRLENDSIMAIIQKVGDMTCFIQNLFIIMAPILIIIQIIKALLSLGFNIPPCSSSNSSSSGCCTPDVCPAFIKDNSTITSSTGNFLYLNEVGIDSGLTLPAGFPPIVSVIRDESWQFYDPNLPQNEQFINITQAYDLPAGTTKVFFPAGTNYTTSTSPTSVPYTINFRFFFNPALWTIANYTDIKGPRYVQAINVIVQSPPTTGVLNWDNQYVAPFNGTLALVGGVMTEDDGVTSILNSQNQTIPLNTFIHTPVDNSGSLTDDGYLFSDLTYSFNINHEILLGEALITVGCIPEVAADRDFINNTISAQFNMNGVNLAAVTLPDVAGTQACITSAITQFTQNISVASATALQNNLTSCLNNLANQTSSALASTVAAGYDQYTSNFALDTTIQFTTRSIHVLVTLTESSGTTMTNNLPASAAATLASQLNAIVTFGNVSPFVYDGYSLFIAEIQSDIPGNGTVKVSFNNNFISVLNNPTDITQTPSVNVTELDYTFVASTSAPEGQPRRDAGDIARDGD